MSLPDYLLEEPEDDEWCPLHERYKPCRGCKEEAAEFDAEARREEGRGTLTGRQS